MKTTTTWYRTERYSATIKPVEVVKETEKMLTLAETRWQGQNVRVAKISDYTRHFKTWAEAREHLIEREERSARGHREKAEKAEANLKALRELIDPAHEF